MVYYQPITKSNPVTGQVTLLVDPNTDVGKYITSEITTAGGNPNNPNDLIKFIADHETKSKSAFAFGIFGVALALLVWWGQKKENLPKGFDFIRNKMVMWALLAACAFLIWRAWDLSVKNKEVQTSLAEFIKFVNAMAAQQQQQQQTQQQPAN